eukprot:3232796-Pleurochrysis_carterae.AAC.1
MRAQVERTPHARQRARTTAQAQHAHDSSRRLRAASPRECVTVARSRLWRERARTRGDAHARTRTLTQGTAHKTVHAHPRKHSHTRGVGSGRA